MGEGLAFASPGRQRNGPHGTDAALREPGDAALLTKAQGAWGDRGSSESPRPTRRSAGLSACVPVPELEARGYLGQQLEGTEPFLPSVP